MNTSGGGTEATKRGRYGELTAPMSTGGGTGDGTGGTGLSQTMADAAVGGGSSSGGGSDNNDTDSLPLSPKKRPRGQGSKTGEEVDEEAVKRRGESTSACSSSLATNYLLVMVERH